MSFLGRAVPKFAALLVFEVVVKCVLFSGRAVPKFAALLVVEVVDGEMFGISVGGVPKFAVLLVVEVVDGEKEDGCTCHNFVLDDRVPCKMHLSADSTCIYALSNMIVYPLSHSCPIESKEQSWRPGTMCTCRAAGMSIGRSSSASCVEIT